MALLIYQVVLLAIIQSVLAKSNFLVNGYYPVPACPTTKTEWGDRSLQLKCNDTHQYHCSPFNTSQLYEFCYKRNAFTVSKGHCLGIAESGNLNMDTCRYFSHGCPEEDYKSNELYKYPSCLSIQDNCFTEDCVCNCLTAKKLNVTKTKPMDTCTNRNNFNAGRCENQNQYLAVFVVFLVLFVLSIASNIFFACKWLTLNKEMKTYPPAVEEQSLVPRATEITMFPSAVEEQPFVPQATEVDRNTVSDRSQSTKLESEVDQNTVSDRLQSTKLESEVDRNTASDRLQSTKLESDDIYRMILVDFTIEDEQLFQLLKRQCLHGVRSEFEYLVITRVKPNKKEYIFEQRDENGCILLHYAAQGGNIIILDKILGITSHKILENRCIRGQWALHFAIKHKQRDMTDHLLNLYSDKKNQETRRAEIHRENIVDTAGGEFSPVFLAAWFGDTRLLSSLRTNGFDIYAKTRSGLNILDIACLNLGGESDVEFEFCEHLLSNTCILPITMDTSKTDRSGWNIAHYASLSNFKLFNYITSKEELFELIMAKTNAKKTCLHIACEFEKLEIVEFITEHSQLQTLIQEKDALGWNALHFAAKGGEVKILKNLLKKGGMAIDCKTNDGKTLLHIACIHKNPKMCKFVLEEFKKNGDKYEELLNAQTINNGLTAAHYLAVEKKEDGREKKIFEMFIEIELMKFSLKSNRGLNVLEFAIDHLNKELIGCILRCILIEKYREKFKITTAILAKYKEDTKDESIKRILQTAMDKINSKI